jgi:hypothetical protein
MEASREETDILGLVEDLETTRALEADFAATEADEAQSPRVLACFVVEEFAVSSQ